MQLDRKKIIPHLKQKSETFLYPTDGCVYSIKEFAKNKKNLLNGYEQGFIEKNLSLLNKSIPDYLTSALTAVEPKNHCKKIPVKGVGSRSVFWLKKKLKFKGCKPKPDLYFPNEQLDFGQTKMTTTKIIFGALSAENVIREILAYCFFSENKLPIFQKPYIIFEYKNNKKIIGYCLVFHSITEKRLESKEFFGELTIKDLITISKIENNFGIKILKTNEADFFGISNDWYSKNKSTLLFKMNFNGGFRGILNSNLGNDIEYKNKFYICDFDTFKIIKIPKKPTQKFVDNFCIWVLTEILKTSPIILNYVDIEKATLKIWEIYKKKQFTLEVL